MWGLQSRLTMAFEKWSYVVAPLLSYLLIYYYYYHNGRDDKNSYRT